MDYKYIEQLIEHYWLCETSLEEEAILRTFFSQENVPAHLLAYRKLFGSTKVLHEAKLSRDFETKILAKIEAEDVEKHVTARKITWVHRLMPLYKAVACVAILLTLGNAAQTSFTRQAHEDDYNYDNYQDSYNDPAVAYDQVSDALQMVSQGLNESIEEDSTSSSLSTPKSEQE